MSWLDTFKDDERSLQWLVQYIHYNNLFYVEFWPRDIHEAREIIQHWERESAERPTARLKYELSKLMKSYFANILPIEDYDWLSANNSKQLCWVLFYINLNPMRQRYDVTANSFCRSSASNIREAYPLIIKTLDSSMPLNDGKKNYLLTLKSAYSQYLIGKKPLPWLDIKDEETCSWVWSYLIEKIDKASGQKGALQFIKPIDNETIFWSCISLIANSEFLKGYFTEKEELTTSLYNAHKQKIHRQKSNSSLGLTKANQKKLTSYAKKQNTTEKKALNDIVKIMLN